MGGERYKWKWVMYPDLRFQQKYNVTSTLVWNEGQNWMEDNIQSKVKLNHQIQHNRFR